MDHSEQSLSIYNYPGKMKITRTPRNENSGIPTLEGIFTLLHPLATPPLELAPAFSVLMKVDHRLPQWPLKQKGEVKTSAWEGVQSITLYILAHKFPDDCMENPGLPEIMLSGEWRNHLIERLRRMEPFRELSNAFYRRFLKKESFIVEKKVRFEFIVIDKTFLEEDLHRLCNENRWNSMSGTFMIIPPAEPHFRLTAYDVEGKGTFLQSGIIRHMQYHTGEGWKKNKDNPGKLTLITDDYTYLLEEQYQV